MYTHTLSKLFFLISFLPIFLIPNPVKGCTIFLLTNESQTLFFNNEDFTNPNTYMWFRPAGEGYYGCAFVGFDNGQAQGGINTEGLAFDIWADGYNPYEWDPSKPRAKGNAPERMLESCATVEEAIAFYKTYAEPGFAHTKMLIADKSGASVIIGSRNGTLFFEKSDQSRVLGASAPTFEELYAKNPTVNMSHGTKILKQCVTTGTFATKYSNIFDLRTGDISLYRFETEAGPTRLNLYEELKKGEHYYEIPQLKVQLQEAPRPLFLNMKRLVLFEYTTLPGQNPTTTSLPFKLLTDLSKGTIDVSQYAAEIGSELTAAQEEIKAELAQMGDLSAVHAIHKEALRKEVIYYYVVLYQNGRILWKIRFNEEQIVQDLQFRAAAITRL